MMPELNARGFAKFGDVVTSYGEIVGVYESSSAEGRYVWLSTRGQAHLEGPVQPWAGIPHGIAPGSVSAHMTVAQATAVRDALTEWLDWVKAEDTPGRTIITEQMGKR
jgi:hypothetical protein